MTTWLDDYRQADRAFRDAQLSARQAARLRAKAIQRARRDGLTQEQIAEAVGVTQQRIQQIAPGRRS